MAWLLTIQQDIKMLSVLIPVYNYPVLQLVSDLHRSCEKAGIIYEILVFEDGSVNFLEANLPVSEISNVRYRVIENNLGRAAIRNLLASEGKYSNLLFLDGDSGIVSDDFIVNYLPYLNGDKVILGGRIYRQEDYREDCSLLYKYGSVREINNGKNRAVRSKVPVFTSPNFLISKNNFQKVCFDETFNEYGHEDSIFGIQLHRESIEYDYINNPVFHLDLESNKHYLAKSEKALTSLLKIHLTAMFPELIHYSRILQVFERIRKSGMMWFLVFKISIIKTLILKNLLSKKPSLFLFDLYKLWYLCKIYLKH